MNLLLLHVRNCAKPMLVRNVAKEYQLGTFEYIHSREPTGGYRLQPIVFIVSIQNNEKSRVDKKACFHFRFDATHLVITLLHVSKKNSY